MFYLKTYLKGMCMGVADLIPGISGGTIAFMTGIYEDLIKATKNIDLPFLKLIAGFKIKEAFEHINGKFLLSVIGGIITSIICLSKVVSWLLNHHPILINAFFFGLIFATIPIISQFIKKWTVKEMCWMIMAAALMYLVIRLSPVQSTNALWFVFLSGAVAISAMILPGISGAFILILLGKYHYILDAVNNRDFLIIGVFICGIVCGIVVVVRILSWLFTKSHDLTIATLTGIVIGSLYKIWPWKVIENSTINHDDVIIISQTNILPEALTKEVWISLSLMVLGYITAVLLNKIDHPNQKIDLADN